MKMMDDMVAELEGECLYDTQHIIIYHDDGIPRQEKQYFSRGELEDVLLLSLKQVRRSEEIPESVEDVTKEERLKVILTAAAIAIRRMADDTRGEEVEDWKKEVWGEQAADRVKTAAMFDDLAKEYEDAAGEL